MARTIDRGSATPAQPTGMSPRDDVFRQQMAVVASVAAVLVLVFSLAPPTRSSAAGFLSWGVISLLAVTVAASAAPWDRYDSAWRLAVPTLDVVAIDLLRIGQPEAGFGIIMTIPVIWLATSRGRLGPALGAVVPAVVLVTQAVLERSGVIDPIRPASLPATGSIILTLAFVSAVVSLSYRRLRVQRGMLRRQSSELESALQTTSVQESTLRSIMDVVRFGLVTFDATGRITHSNRAARELMGRFGIDRGTPVEDMPLYAADGTTRLRREDMPLARALRGQEVVNDVMWIGHRDGPRVAVDVAAQLIMRPDGSIDRVVLVLRDMTADLAAERRRDDLVTSLSHEFRTPLSSVLGYLELAMDDPDLPEAAREQLDIARRNTVRLQSMVGDLLVTRSRETVSADLTLERVDLTGLAAEAVRSLDPVAADRSVSLRVESTGPAWVRVDAFRLRQVLDNLLSNAIKYNKPGGDVVVAVEPEDDGGHVVRVSDTGQGLEPADAARLFEPFFRTEGARTSGTVGTGLGLTICREIVEQHGGTIEVESAVGRGTVVSVHLVRSEESVRGA